MQIKTLDDIKAYTSKMDYRGGTEKYHDKYVYICQPVNYIEEGLKRMDVWSGHIVYCTNASSKKVGTYWFVLDKKNDPLYKERVASNPIHIKLSPMWVNPILAKVRSEENCKAYPDKFVPLELFTEEKNKAVFTSREEAEEYLKNIREGVISIPVIEHIVTITAKKYEDGKMVEQTETYRLPLKKKDGKDS